MEQIDEYQQQPMKQMMGGEEQEQLQILNVNYANQEEEFEERQAEDY